MEITKEQAKSDLEKIGTKFGTSGCGNENDRLAQLVIQTIEVLERRMENPKTIKMLYVDNPEASKLLPPTIYNTAKQYAEGKIKEIEAKKILKDALIQYELVFQEMGIDPQHSNFLFNK